MMQSRHVGGACRLALLAVATVLGSFQVSADATGNLKVTSFPPGAEVWIDGAFSGKTTPATVVIETGEHEVTVKAPGAGWVPVHRLVVIATGTSAVEVTLVPEVTQGLPGPAGPMGPEGPQGPAGPPGEAVPENVTVEVDCGAGQRVLPALAVPAVHLTISILGTCDESVEMTRDNVTLRAEAPGAGLRATSTAEDVLHLAGARNVILRDLVLQGGRVALAATNGATFDASGLDVTAAGWGVQMSDSIGYFFDGRIHDNLGDGVNLHPGASLSLYRSEVFNNVSGIATTGGEVQIEQNTTIRDNAWFGVFAMSGTNVEFHGATVMHNPTGLFLTWGASAAVHDSRIVANAGDGVSLMSGSVLALLEGASVEDNAGNGVSASGTCSVVANNLSAVRANHHDGIYLSETAELFINNASIEDNEGWGVRCAPVPDVVGIHGSYGLDPSKVGPNGLGRVSCPGVSAP